MNNKVIMAFLLSSFVLQLGCGYSHHFSSSTSSYTTTTSPFGEGDSMVPGIKSTFSADGVSFNMISVPGGLTFPTGFYNDGPDATVANAYLIGETEVTYELWYKVYTWAIANGYTFANPGREGKLGINGAAPTAAKNQPATFVSWRDAIVFGNALTEWYNAKAGTAYTLAYYSDAAYTIPIKTSSDDEMMCATAGCIDDPYVKADATGFRLPTTHEWELAARYKDGTDWTPGNYASGATAPYTDALATQLVDWYSLNSSNVTHDVKGKLPNALGLYDMSGNVWEWNFEYRNPNDIVHDWCRLIRGGSWRWADYMQVGNANDGATAWFAYHEVGFRFVKTDL